MLTPLPVADDSLLSCPGLQLAKDPGYRSSAFPHTGQGGKSRRQSMLL